MHDLRDRNVTHLAILKGRIKDVSSIMHLTYNISIMIMSMFFSLFFFIFFLLQHYHFCIKIFVPGRNNMKDTCTCVLGLVLYVLLADYLLNHKYFVQLVHIVHVVQFKRLGDWALHDVHDVHVGNRNC